MGRLSTPHPEITEHSLIGEAGDVYECASLAAIDAHVLRLTARLRAAHDEPGAIRVITDDRDRLLELRLLMTPEHPQESPE